MDDIPLFDGDELLALARLDIEANRLDAALAKIKRAFALDAHPVELYSVGARIYAQLRLFEKARSLYTRFLEEQPDSVTDRFQLGMVHYDNGDRAQALATWQALLEAHPTHPPTLYYSSVALVEQKDIEAAKRNIDVLLKSAPVSNLYFERGKELLATINQDTGQAAAQSKRLRSAYDVDN